MEPLHDSDSSTVLSLTRSRTASLERANTSTKRVEKCGVEEGRHYEGRGTLDDPFVVRWAEGDPRNPLNWSPTRRWLIVLSVALSTMWSVPRRSVWSTSYIVLTPFVFLVSRSGVVCMLEGSIRWCSTFKSGR